MKTPWPSVARLVVSLLPRLLLSAAWLLVACGDDRPNAPERVATVIADSLVFTRADSTVVAMGTTPLVCCGLFDPSFVNEPAIRVVLYDPANQKAGWQIIILTNQAQAADTTFLPTTAVAPSKIPAVSMYIPDFETGNELSSDTEESSGTIVVHWFSCGSTKIQIHFSVDATLGSEFGGGSTMDVKGTFQATFPKVSCPE